jgi:hypothetical protein
MENDEKIRKEFAKAFNWYSKRGPYDNYDDTKPRLPSWEEIFVELGKILATRDFRDIEGNVSELEYKLQGVEKRLNPLS